MAKTKKLKRKQAKKKQTKKRVDDYRAYLAALNAHIASLAEALRVLAQKLDDVRSYHLPLD